MAENRNPFLNQSGCPDPTAYHALKPIMQEDAALEGKVNFLIKCLNLSLLKAVLNCLHALSSNTKRQGGALDESHSH